MKKIIGPDWTLIPQHGFVVLERVLSPDEAKAWLSAHAKEAWVEDQLGPFDADEHEMLELIE